VRQKVGLGFGLAMEDSMAGAPYFYMSGYPLQGTIEYNNLPQMESARWTTGEHWQRAILTLDKLTSGNFDDNRQVIIDYLLNAINWFIRNE